MTEINDTFLALVDNLLVSAGMQRVDASNAPPALWGIYEDAYAVAGIAEFGSIGELIEGWMDAQESLADVMSRSVTNIGAKAWDGYLVLLCAQPPLGEEPAELTKIRSNTRRTRKLLVVDDNLRLADSHGLTDERVRLRRALAPLMPLELPNANGFTDPLEGLPTRVSVAGFTAEDLGVLVSSYERREPLVAALHARLEGRHS